MTHVNRPMAVRRSNAVRPSNAQSGKLLAKIVCQLCPSAAGTVHASTQRVGTPATSATGTTSTPLLEPAPPFKSTSTPSNEGASAAASSTAAPPGSAPRSATAQVSSGTSSPMARALEHACQDKDAPQRTLPWGPNLPHDADGLAKLLFNEVARVGLAEMERKARSFEDHIPYLNRHRSGGPHPCDTATVEFEKAYLQSLRQQQGEVTAALQPSLVAMAESSLLESEARMQEFRRHYGVQPGARLPPPAGSVYAQRQESLRADAGRLLEAHQRLTQAKTPDERQARWREFVAVHAEVSEQHPMLSGMTPGQDLTLLESLTKYSSPVTLRRALTERIINAQNLRNELRARPEIVWEMEPLVEGLIDHLGLAKDDPTAVLARDKVRQQLDRDRTTRTLLSVASVGLVATGMVLGGPVGWGLGAAAAATDAADFGIFAQRFALHSAANRIDVDPHRNLSDVCHDARPADVRGLARRRISRRVRRR